MKTIGDKLSQAYRRMRPQRIPGVYVEEGGPPYRLGRGVPPGVRVYATGDIHGRADLLEARMMAIDADLEARPVERPIEVYLGDYVDRGPASAFVIDLLLARREARSVVTLLGNHEMIFRTFLETGGKLDHWARLGGLETIASYGISTQADEDPSLVADRLKHVLPPDHVKFLGELRPSFMVGDCFFVHAGVRPGVQLTRQRLDDMIWIRDPFLKSDADFGALVFHGHTPEPEPEVLENRVNLDTLAYSSGRLTTAVIEGDRLEFLD